MNILRRLLMAAGLALALAGASHVPASAQASVAHWRGHENEQLIDRALRRYGFRPNRLTDVQVRALNRARAELLGPTTRRVALNRAQATAIVYLALVEPVEDRRHADRRDDGYDRPGDRDPDRDGVWDRDWNRDPYGRGGWGAECDALQADAYRLGNLVSAPRQSAGLFVDEPERGRARSLARQIQERALQCRAPRAADRAGEVMSALSAALPRRTDVSRRVDALKHEIQQAAPARRNR